MMSGTNSDYSTGYKSPENPLKQLNAEYHHKDSFVSAALFLFVIMIGYILLNMETFDWTVFAQKVLILGLCLLLIFVFVRFRSKKEKIPAFSPENYKQIVQDLKSYYKPNQRSFLFFPLQIIFFVSFFFIIDGASLRQISNWNFWNENYLIGIIVLTASFIYDTGQRYRKYQQLRSLETKF
ncbi:MAG: hypothetical protein IPI60_19975 [Saprospiraceae bacterium]|nr:hypothetical protein [Saprospiraceae bacterium]